MKLANSFTYACAECGSQAKNNYQEAPALKGGAPSTDKQTLGTWSCSKCNKRGVKVRRERVGKVAAQ